MDIKQVEDIVAVVANKADTFADIKFALEATVMIELIKLLRAENANRQENGRTSEPD